MQILLSLILLYSKNIGTVNSIFVQNRVRHEVRTR